MKTHGEQGGHKSHRKRLGPGLPLEKMAHRAESKWDKRALKSAPDWRTAAARAKLKKLKAKLGLPPKQPHYDDDEQQQLLQPRSSKPTDEQQQEQEEEEQQQQQQQQQQLRHTQEARSGTKRRHGPTHLQRIAAEKAVEKEARRKEQEERRAAAEERRRQLEAQHKQRAERGKQLRKKTVRGQPVMRTRIEGLLAKLAS